MGGFFFAMRKKKSAATEFKKVLKGLGQGCIASPTRCKLTLALVQKAVSRLCGGFQFRADGRAVPQLSYADDAALISNADTVGGAVATLQLAFETTWMVSLRCLL